MCVKKIKNSKFIKMALCAFLFASVSAICGCSTAQTNKVVIDQFPNTAAENSTVCQEYSDIANSMTDDIINEFMEITKIPRPSGYLDQITSYLSNKIIRYGLTPQIDTPSQTLYFDIPSTDKPEFQQAPSVIFQAHTDMVTTTSDDNKDFNFLTTPLEIDYDMKSDQIHSKDYKTNIGADDGQGIALILALAKNRYSFDHGAIRVILTQNEETTCEGAENLTPSIINSDYLINVDGYQVGNVLCSSAGILTGKLQSDFEQASIEPDDKLISISWNGLAGGHTGLDVTKSRIHATEAVIEYFRLLDSENIPYKIANIQTGTVHNAYPSSFTIKYYLNEQYFDKASEIVQKEYDEYKRTMTDESDFNFEIQLENDSLSALTYNDSKQLLANIDALPEGVIEEGQVNPNVPKSSCAYSVLVINNNHCNMSFSFRSSSNEAIDEFEQKIEKFAKDNQIQYDLNIKMKGWDFKEDNPLAQTLLDSFKFVANFEGDRTTIHGGLEASYFIEKHPSLHMVSIGLDVANEHMIDETIYTKTIDVYVASVLYTLQHLPKI